MRLSLLLLALLVAAPRIACADVFVAVAAAAGDPVGAIAKAFTAKTGAPVFFGVASSGRLYSQLQQGVPYDVFLAADTAYPARAIHEGLALSGTRFTYAIGRLALYSSDPKRVTGPGALTGPYYASLAIGDPDVSPYGSAATDTLTGLGIYDRVKTKLVKASNVDEVYRLVSSGDAEMGFLADAQIAKKKGGSRWIVPDSLHIPLAQDAVLLEQGASNKQARAFVDFLKGPEAHAILSSYGYELPGS